MKSDVEFTDEIDSIRKEVTRLQSENVNIIIAVGHSGYAKDKQIAREINGLDLVIGGHSHSLLWNNMSPEIETIEGPYPTYITQNTGKKIPVVQLYAFTKYLGKLHLKFNSEGELITLTGFPIILNSTIPDDIEVSKIVERYKSDLESLQSTVIGSTSVKLDQQSCFTQECNLGNMIADAMVYKYVRQYKKDNWTESPMAVIHAGGIRASLDRSVPSNITNGDLMSIYPFSGNVTEVEINGSDIMRMLEHCVINFKEYTPEFLQFSGLKVEYNLSKPKNSRVVNVWVRCCGDTVHSPLFKDKIYHILMPQFLSAGGDGFSVFSTLPSNILNFNVLESLADYIESHSPVHPDVEGRIVQVI